MLRLGFARAECLALVVDFGRTLLVRSDRECKKREEGLVDATIFPQ
jgi:hypothetical protein